MYSISLQLQDPAIGPSFQLDPLTSASSIISFRSFSWKKKNSAQVQHFRNWKQNYFLPNTIVNMIINFILNMVRSKILRQSCEKHTCTLYLYELSRDTEPSRHIEIDEVSGRRHHRTFPPGNSLGHSPAKPYRPLDFALRFMKELNPAWGTVQKKSPQQVFKF